MTKRTQCLFVLALLFVCGGLSAQQNAQEMRIGSIISGNLDSGQEIWYRVRTTELCFLTIETMGTIDTYLEVYDERQNILAYNDDGGNNSNAKVEMLSASGSVYLVKLRGYGSGDYGSFRIFADQTPISNMADLNVGATVSGNLSTGQKQLYRVRAAGTGFFTVETAGNFDTYLEAYDSSFKLLASDDDGGDNNNARLELLVENNQTYYILLRGFGDSSGSYRILTGFEPIAAASTNNISRATAVALNLGQETLVAFTSSASRWYSVRVTQTGIVSFTVRTTGNLDTLLYLYDSQGNLLEQDDDSGEYNNASITTRVNAGTYYIEVKEYGGGLGRCAIQADVR